MNSLPNNGKRLSSTCRKKYEVKMTAKEFKKDKTHQQQKMSTTKPGQQKKGYPGERMPGRTRFTKELGRRICERIADGEGLMGVAREFGLPNRTVSSWVKRYAGFAADYARACETRLCLMEERLLALCEAAQEAANSGEPDARVRIEAAKLEIDTIKWTLSRLLPARWGERNKLELTGAGGEPLLPKHTVEEDKAYLAMLAETQKIVNRQS